MQDTYENLNKIKYTPQKLMEYRNEDQLIKPISAR